MNFYSSPHTLWYSPRAGSLLFLLISLLVPASGVAAMDIDWISIRTRSQRSNGTLETFPYDLGIFLQGRGIASVTVTMPNVMTPGACDGALIFEGAGEWLNEWCCYEDLDIIRNDPCLGFGDFEFEFTGELGETDIVTLTYDPGPNPAGPVTGYAIFTNPVHQESSVALDPTFAWTCSGVCGPDGWNLEVGFEPPCDLDKKIVYLGTTPDGVFSWAPGPILPNCSYNAIAESTVNLSGGPIADLTSGGDPFIYEPVFHSGNLILFSALERIELFVDTAGLNWTALTSESSYDVVAGNLDPLSGSGGDFGAATSGCIADDLSATILPFSGEPSVAGEGFWFLVRGSTSADGYDSLQMSQLQDRDGGIDSSGVDCP